MDYSLGAVKALCSLLKNAKEAPTQNFFTLGGVLFQRAWLQGVLLSDAAGECGDRLVLDDGTGVFELCLGSQFRLRQWRTGMYVMVVGAYNIRTGDIPLIKVHKIVDLSSYPHRETLWYLEVMEAHNLFYQPLIEEFT